MKDEELIMLRNKALIGIVILLLFAIPIFFIINNKILIKKTNVIKSIEKKEDILVLVISENCSKCKKYEKELIKLNVNYFLINKDTEKTYNRILSKLKLGESDVIAPTLLYIKKGKAYSTLVDIKNEKEIDEYIKNYELSN